MESIVILALLGVFLMMSGLYSISRKSAHWITIGGVFAAFLANAYNWEYKHAVFNNMLIIDNYGVAFGGTILATTLGLLLVSTYFFDKIENYVTEHYALLVFAIVGMLCMVTFDNLSMLFIGIEIMSVCLYILAGSKKKDVSSNEAALKYFLMGSFTTGILLMGIALVYGATGSFYLSEILRSMAAHTEPSPLLLAGMLFLLVGMGFKVSAAPFHFWTPDVYQGSPSFVTAFMSTVVKIAGFAAFFRLFYICFTPVEHYWLNIVWVMIVLTISIGSITAVRQTSVKRLLAFSSIAHAGYMLITVLTGAESADLLFYSVAYATASVVAFGVLMVVESETGSDEISAFAGLVKRNKSLAFLFTIAMASMAGLPLTAGFFAKVFVLKSALLEGYNYLVIIAIVNAIIGIYYYFKVIIAMYFKDNETNNAEITVSGLYTVSLFVGAALIIILGLYPDLLYQLV